MKSVRHDPTLRIAGFVLSLVALVCGLQPAVAWGDGGTVRLAQETGGYRITVFTAPNPIRVGSVDLSVLVQDAETSDPIGEACVHVHLSEPSPPGETIEAIATRGAATNKLLQAAMLTIPSPGGWVAIVDVEGPRGPAQVRFEIEVAEPLPEWRALWPWFSWPAVAVLLFGTQQFLMQRRSD